MGGIATSLLFSIFEAWLIRAHADAKLGPSWLGKSFTWAAYGNSIIAIASGLVANHAAESSTLQPVTAGSALHMGGYLAPFDMALVVSVVCGVAALYCWEENYGEITKTTPNNHRDDAIVTTSSSSSQSSSSSAYGGLATAFTVTMRSREVLLCGLVSALYEGSMYVSFFFPCFIVNVVVVVVVKNEKWRAHSSASLLLDFYIHVDSSLDASFRG